MSDNYSEADIAQFLDREAIRDVEYRYAHAIDRFDAELLRTIYWPDAIDDHGDFKGSPEEFIDWVFSSMKDLMSITQHFMGNILIRIEGKVANVETYFQAFHRWEKPDAPAADLVIGGRYLDRMEKRGKEWRVAHRVVAFDYFREYSDSGDWAHSQLLNPHRTLGKRNPDDATRPLFGRTLEKVPF
jgi:SnoaL-like domain